MNFEKKTDSYCKIADIYEKITSKDYLNPYEIFIKKLKNKKVLDLGCGTGVLLRKLSDDNITVGIDLSARILAEAKSRDSKTVFLKGDIRKLKTLEKFDVVFCTFDTINHLLKIKDWEKVFKVALAYLKRGGLFLFDYSTPEGLKINSNFSKKVNIGKNKIIFKARAKEGFLEWTIKSDKVVFKLREVSFKEDIILGLIKPFFSEVKIFFKSKKDARAYVVAKK